jgi:hypothetical protein
MAKMTNIWFDTVNGGEQCRYNLRIDWDNDRHQAINLESLSAEDVEAGLFKSADLLRIERLKGEI